VVVGYLRIPVASPVGSKICELLEVFLKHRPGPRPHSVFLRHLETL
jgi:hypothetical protein